MISCASSSTFHWSCGLGAEMAAPGRTATSPLARAIPRRCAHSRRRAWSDEVKPARRLAGPAAASVESTLELGSSSDEFCVLICFFSLVLLLVTELKRLAVTGRGIGCAWFQPEQSQER